MFINVPIDPLPVLWQDIPMDIDQEVERIKQELTDIIVQKSQANKMDPNVAQKLAADFLAALPIKDQQDLILKLKNLGEQYEEARAIYVREFSKFEEERRHKALTQMHEHIQNGNIDAAIAVAKQYQNAQ